MTGVQTCALPISTNLVGVHGAIYSSAETTKGVEWGFVNNNTMCIDGAQLGAVNLGNLVRGAQLGFFNKAVVLKGAQLGFVNYADTVDGGIQIGLANIIKNDGWLPFMVFVNGRI